MHNSHQSFAVRQRVQQQHGPQRQPGGLVHRHDARHAEGQPDARGAGRDGRVDDEHAPRRRARASSATSPAKAVDSCFDLQGQPIYAGADAWSGILDSQRAGACTQKFPLYGTSRTVAGAPIEGGIYSCALQAGGAGRGRRHLRALDARRRRRGAAEVDLPAGRVRLHQAGPGQTLKPRRARRRRTLKASPAAARLTHAARCLRSQARAAKRPRAARRTQAGRC